MKWPDVVAGISREPVFRSSLLLSGSVSTAQIRLQLARWVRSGRLIQLRRGLYVLAPPWVAVALLSVALTLAAGVARWRLLFYPGHRARSWRKLAYALLIGQSINILLPLRFGELARAGLLSATDRAPIARVLATLAVERLADLVILGLATALLLLLSVPLPHWLHAPGQALVALAAGALAIVIALGLDARRAAGWTERAARRLPDRLRTRAARHIDEAAAGLSSLRSVAASAQLWGLSAAILLLAATTNYLLFVAFGFELPAIAALFLLVVLQVGNSAVSVPGNLGVFHRPGQSQHGETDPEVQQ